MLWLMFRVFESCITMPFRYHRVPGVHRILDELFRHDVRAERAERIVVLADEPVGAAHLPVAAALTVRDVMVRRIPKM